MNLPRLGLSARYRWLLIAVALPLFVVIMLLAVQQYRDLRAQILHSLAHITASHAIAVDSVAKLASDHVMRMQAWSENHLRSPHSFPSDLRAYYQPRYAKGTLDGYTLDNVPKDKRQLVGQLVWFGGDPRQPDVGEVKLDHALEFFSLARLTHDVTPYFQWSYFFSAGRDFIALYPWIGASELLEVGGQASLRKALPHWFQYEIYLAGTPAENSDRVPYWTAPYVDAGGTGPMVSHGAPVYVEGQFQGIVGTDFTLTTLERFLSALPIDVGRMLIIDAEHMVLADTAGSPLDATRKWSGVIPETLPQAALAEARQNDGDPVHAGVHVLVTKDAEHAPWTLVYVVSDEEITRLLLPRLQPYAVILIVLVATVSIALYLLRREFISPALALVEYIRDASRNPSAQEPRLPSLWQTWVQVVSRAFSETRSATRRVQESEERLRQILNNSSAAIYVRDLEGRFILVNRHFERLIGIGDMEIAGKSLVEVFPPHTAAHFAENDRLALERNKVMEFEEELGLEDGVHTYLSMKFPLYDADGEHYAICGISTDITERKRSEEVLRQAALGISSAHGEEIFNSLVQYLSKVIGADYAFIGLLENGGCVRTRALSVHGRIEENITYPLEGSPCRDVVGSQFRFYPDRLQQRFPQDLFLKDAGMQSYAAIPLFDSSGGTLGVLAVMHSESLGDEVLVESLLQIFAGRAASELERERADTALRASEASYRAIFEASEDAIFVHDLETGAILDVNKKACDIYGYSYDEMLEVDVGTLSSGESPYTQEDAARLIGRAVQGEHLHFEWHRRNRDNSLHWDDVFARRVTIGGIDRILVHTREITARKEAEERLRDSEKQHREANRKLIESEAFKTSIVDGALLGVITMNEAGEIVEFNPASVRMFGHDKERAVGSELADLIIPERFRDRHRRAVSRYLATGEGRVLGKRFELSAVRADGGEFPVELSISVHKLGDVNYFTAFIADLTEKKAAERALRSSEEQYRSIFNTTSDAMILWSAKGEIVDLNPATWKMGGFTREEFLSKPIEQHIHASSQAAFGEFMDAVTRGRSFAFEAMGYRKDNSVINLETRTVPMLYQGEPHVLSISRDITEQKRAEKELAKQREALRQSEKLSAMGELLAGVAHELNNPLAILMGRAALLESKTREPEVKAEVEKIHAAADRCGRIVHTFLSMVKQRAQERKQANLNEIVESALELLGYSLRTSGIEIKTLLAAELPDQRVDVDQIGQVVINLLVNAQHVLLEQPEPRSMSVETGRSQQGIYLLVADNGPGVPAELRQRIFDPFFTTKKTEVGTGIGLSVSRGIAREHGGELRLLPSESGAVFELTLPLSAQSVYSPVAVGSPIKRGESGQHVLIVEDEPEIADLLAEILQSAGFQTSCTSSGRDAADWLKRNRCDLVLSDIRMPDLDGPGLWYLIKRHHPELVARTAFVTGDTLSAAIAPFLKETGAPLLEKPFTPEQVLALVARLEDG